MSASPSSPGEGHLESMFERLPAPARRVRCYRNGFDGEFGSVTIAARSMRVLLHDATERLKLPHKAKRLYTETGETIVDFSALEADQRVFVSTGEAWIDPSAGARPITVTSIGKDNRLVRPLTKRLFAKVNGSTTDDHVIVVAPMLGLYTPTQEMEMLLAEATSKLGLAACAKYVFAEDGSLVASVADLVNGQTIFLSCGEPWRDPLDRSPAKFGRRIADDHRLLAMPAKAVLALRNGHKTLIHYPRPDAQLTALRDEAVHVVGNDFTKLMDAATSRLQLVSSARRMYSFTGALIKGFEDVVRGELYFFSCGEGFIDPLMPTAIAARQITELAADSHLSPTPKARVTTYRNGETEEGMGVRVVMTTDSEFLSTATRKLGLPSVARRVFTMDGKLISDLSSIENGASVVVTCGEPFKTKDPALQEASQIVAIDEDSRLLAANKARVLVYRNGWGTLRTGKTVVGGTVKEILREATAALGLSITARRLHLEDGTVVKDIGMLKRGQTVYVSHGEAFVGAQALSQRKASPQ